MAVAEGGEGEGEGGGPSFVLSTPGKNRGTDALPSNWRLWIDDLCCYCVLVAPFGRGVPKKITPTCSRAQHTIIQFFHEPQEAMR